MGETKNEYKGQVKEARKDMFWEKRLHGTSMKDVSEVADERLCHWHWLRGGYLGGGCRSKVWSMTCGKDVELVGWVCGGLVHREYWRRYDEMGLSVYWGLCQNYFVKCCVRRFQMR